MPKPAWIDALELRLGAAIPIHPHVLSAAKLVVVTPLMALALLPLGKDGGPLWHAGPAVTIALFFAFAALDALDGIVARARGLDTGLGRVLDRLTDYPLLLVIGAASLPVLPVELVAAKLALDGILLALFAWKGRSVATPARNADSARIRTTMTDASVLAMLLAAQGVLHPFVSTEIVAALLWVNILFSATVGLYNAGVLRKRFIADALSAANALCGALSIWMATQQRPELCLLLLLVGAGFDGLDGAAARRWGGTRFGVYSDDVADAINYAIAPGVALACSLSGVEGTAVGATFSVLTLARLVFFTLNKSRADPGWFSGVPSTIGGIVVLCALILFPERHALVGLHVGIAVVLMVSFDSSYRHLGRALFGARRSRTLLALVAGLVLVAGGFLAGPRIPVAIVLGLCLVYGFAPQVARFRDLVMPTKERG